MTISDVLAKTHCHGRRIDLSWVNGEDVDHITIVRRRGSYVFEYSDDHHLVYDGDVISEFIDSGVLSTQTVLASDAAVGATVINVTPSIAVAANTRLRIEQLTGEKKFEIVVVVSVLAGAITIASPLVNAYESSTSNRVSEASELIPNTFYYYTIYWSTDGTAPATWGNTHFWGEAGLFWGSPDVDATRGGENVYGLSIREMDSKNTFFVEETPDAIIGRDEVTDTSGGNGALVDLYDVYGCWLDIMRGWTEALSTLSNADSRPWHTLGASNYALGIDPEGYTYDYETLRRTALQLPSVYAKRGTCPGMVAAVMMFTKWDAECIEAGNAACRGRSGVLTTWDGESSADTNIDEVSAFTSVNRSLTDSSQSWEVDLWAGGILVDSMGNILCVAENTATVATFEEPLVVTTLDASASSGGSTVPVASTNGLRAHLKVQIESATVSTTAEVVEILTVTPGVSFTTRQVLVNSYVSGAKVSIGKSLIETEYVGTGTWATVGGTTRSLTETNASWVENQWKNYYVLTADNQKILITSNTGTVITVTNGSLPTTGAFAIAKDFTVGGSFAARESHLSYTIYNGSPTFIFEPTFDLETIGTKYDPYNRISEGVTPGLNLTGTWGPQDVGIYILTEIATHIGSTTVVPSSPSSVLTLDPSSVAPTTNAWAGLYLNPNQNQTKLFRIVSNTTTTVTVDGDLSTFVALHQLYYVLTSRNATRFKRISARLGPPNREFANADVNVHVLLG